MESVENDETVSHTSHTPWKSPNSADSHIPSATKTANANLQK